MAGRGDAGQRGDAAADGRHPGPVRAVAGYGYCPTHSHWYWGSKLLLICTCDGTVTGFTLANSKLFGEREEARQMLDRQPPAANRLTGLPPAPSS